MSVGSQDPDQVIKVLDKLRVALLRYGNAFALVVGCVGIVLERLCPVAVDLLLKDSACSMAFDAAPETANELTTRVVSLRMPLKASCLAVTADFQGPIAEVTPSIAFCASVSFADKCDGSRSVFCGL